MILFLLKNQIKIHVVNLEQPNDNNIYPCSMSSFFAPKPELKQFLFGENNRFASFQEQNSKK